MILRPYQSRVLEELWQWFATHPEGNPIVEAVVGAGKSVLIAELCKRAIADQPDCRILVVVHQKELLEQNLEKLTKVWPTAPVGIYSASMAKRQLGHQITYCTIGSVAKRAHELGHVDLMLADECHLINPKEEGMWRLLVNDLQRFCPHMRVIGWTGTPYRGDGVWLTAAENPLFTHIAAKVKMRELLELGFLAPLETQETGICTKADGIAIQQGDYNIKQLAARVDRPDVVSKACDNIVIKAANRKRWLVFCVTIAHAQHVRDALIDRGIVAEMVSAETPKEEREDIINRFRNGEIRALCNVAVLTTGFDVPAVDCIALLRNTQSPVLYVQIAGRGMRVLGADINESVVNGKADCLWLDYTDTTSNLGPVDAITGRGPRRKSSGEAPRKVCDECGNLAPISAAICPECGAMFDITEGEIDSQHGTAASTARILTISKPTINSYRITDIAYAVHRKPGKPPSMRVDYYAGIRKVVSEYVCFEHEGYAAKKAARWWQNRGGAAAPLTVEDALQKVGTLPKYRNPVGILVNESEKYPSIVSFIYGASEHEPERVA